MNALILGSGGREHALAHKISQSKKINELFIAPGNAGTDELGKNINLKPTDFDAVLNAINEHKINLLVVGPEDPLVKGIRNFLENQPECKDLIIVGPGKVGALLEGSKDFAKQFMQRHNIPTAAYKSFTIENISKGYDFLDTLNPPYVLKADGLAAGKGVLILEDIDLAKLELQNMLMQGKFGEAAARVVIEEFLDGIEFSVFALTDGKDYVLLPEAKDYKRIGDGDRGLNTGGMGAISPVPFFKDELRQKTLDKIIKPTIEGLRKDDIAYAGFVFFGLINVEGEPFVIEYNVRLGDPETEVVLPRIKSDLVEMFEAMHRGKLSEYKIEVDEHTASTVMVVSQGYPEQYEKGFEITGLQNVENALVFHAGTKLRDGKVETNGGRVMAFTGMGKNKDEALKASYNAISKVCYEGITFRKDIGFDL